MKIIVSKDEIEIIVENHLRCLGYSIISTPGWIEHTEGNYEDVITTIEGISFLVGKKEQ